MNNAKDIPYLKHAKPNPYLKHAKEDPYIKHANKIRNFPYVFFVCVPTMFSYIFIIIILPICSVRLSMYE